jgi:hypothetical protein
MGRRNLLLCFDAFGTLFTPKRPIAEQYATVARQCGLDGFSTEQVQASFKTAFSGESKAHPNYGKASNMGAEQWWTNVSHLIPTSLHVMTLTWDQIGHSQDIPAARRRKQGAAQRSSAQAAAPLLFG